MVNEKEFNKETELKNCSFVKTMLMLSIVFYHSILFWRGDWISTFTPTQVIPLFAEAANFLASFHIYAFAFVSGYLFYYVKFERNGYASFLVFFEKKVKRLLIPFIFFSAVWVTPFGYFLIRLDKKELVQRILLGQAPGQLWFLLMLFWGLLILFSVSGIIKKNLICAGIVAFLCFCFGVWMPRYIPNYYQLWTAFCYVPFLILGFVTRQYDFKRLRKIPCFVWLLLQIALLILPRWISGTGFIFSLLGVGMPLLAHLFGAIWAFTFLSKVAVFARASERKWVSFLSKRSMVVFLIHQQLIYVMVIFLDGWISPYILGPLTFAVVLAVSLGISSLLLRFRATRFLSGEKV